MAAEVVVVVSSNTHSKNCVPSRAEQWALRSAEHDAKRGKKKTKQHSQPVAEFKCWSHPANQHPTTLILSCTSATSGFAGDLLHLRRLIAVP